MLVIRRRRGEILVIGGNIEIEILDASNSSVKLGIRAPREIPVLRKEIQLTCDQNQAAARSISGAALKDLLTALKATPSATISAL
jgi:carbon storage regulator